MQDLLTEIAIKAIQKALDLVLPKDGKKLLQVQWWYKLW